MSTVSIVAIAQLHSSSAALDAAHPGLQVRDIVAYATARFIDIVPEIELPGHCGAALAAYPYLSCTEAVTEVPRQWGVHADVYCAGMRACLGFRRLPSSS